MLFLPPNLLIQDPGQQKMAERSGTSMQGNLYVFEELRDGFLPNLNRYHANTAASKVGKNTIGFGCRAVRYYRRPAQKAAEGDKPEIDHWNDNVMLLGQQGIIRNISDDGIRALVRFQGARIKRDNDNQPVLDDEGDPTYLQEWVPAPFLRAGYREWDSWEDVIVTSSSRIAKVSMEDVDAVNEDDYPFSKAVKVFLQTIVASELPWMPSKFYELVGRDGENIGSVAQKIVDGLVQFAQSELNEESVTIHDLLDVMPQIGRKTPLTDSGVYVRTYWDTAHKVVEALYVGRTSSLAGRYVQYMSTTLGTDSKYHASLVKKAQESGHDDMHAIWYSSPDDDIALQILAEQVFMSLLQSYNQNVEYWGDKNDPTVISNELEDLDSLEVKRTNDKKLWLKALMQAYNDMQKIGEQTIEASGWQGGVLKPQFGVSRGLNVSSPLFEMSKLPFQQVCVRQDGFIRDPDTGELIEVANFTFAKPHKCTYWLASAASTKVESTHLTYWSSPFAFNTESATGRYKVHMDAVVPNKKLDGYDYPGEGVPVHTTFQVRLDGKRHSHSWARLPYIGVFADWTRASSFACMVRWQDPNGQWRRRWVQSQISTPADPQVPGSFRAYATGISLLRMLLGERRDDNDKRAWVYTFSPIPVEVVTYDYLAQRRFIHRAPYEIPPPVGTTSRRYDPQSMLAMMRTFPVLKNVNVSWKNARKSNFPIDGKRKTCDACLVYNKKCMSGGDDLVCELCAKILGLPCCSYTPGAFNPTASTPQGATSERVAMAWEIRACFYKDEAANEDSVDAEDPGFNAITLHDDVAAAAAAHHEDVNGDEDENEDKDEEDDMERY